MSQWITIEAERVLYVDRGRDVIVCDRGFSGPTTLLVKIRNLEESAVATLTITGRPANGEMIEGYFDGRDPTSPEPSANRSRSYRHGFANGRDDSAGKPRDSFENINRMADEAMEADDADAMWPNEAAR